VPQLSDLPPYPLEQVLDVKKKRVEDAELVVKEKQKALEIEQDKLKKREEERDKVKNHYQDKLLQLRHQYDEGTTSDKIDQAKLYIKVVQERLKVEEKKVKDQQAQVETAEKNLELAKNQLRARRKFRTEKKMMLVQRCFYRNTLKIGSKLEEKLERRNNNLWYYSPQIYPRQTGGRMFLKISKNQRTVS
jgi:flagellar biosynthesis chaperone FliJ